jgi:hypothetical protein
MDCCFVFRRWGDQCRRADGVASPLAETQGPIERSTGAMTGTITEEIERTCAEIAEHPQNPQAAIERFAARLQTAWSTDMSPARYLVWSNEHRGWWCAGSSGYSIALPKAGRYTREQAIDICRRALPTAMHIGMISELPVRLDDIADILRDQPVPGAIFKEAGES